jgi:alginate O-acetyltransferase complex protein AlgI
VLNSVNSIIFILIALVAFYATPPRTRWLVLLLTGLAFYWLFSSRMQILVPVVITITSYAAALAIKKHPGNKLYFVIPVLIILGLLVFYKYLGFLANSFSSVGVDLDLTIGKIIVPLGISYITFQAIGYLIDVKNSDIEPEKRFGHLAAFYFYFPKITAGPVEKVQHVIPQLQAAYKLENIIHGLKLICWGVFKKMVIADRILAATGYLYDNPSANSGMPMLIACFLFPIELYFDFSAYTDIARGVSRLFGIDLLQNFDRPFASGTVTDFWRKWHMSLSSWFNQYVFSGLTFINRNLGLTGLFISLVVTFVLIGFWHGATWNFIIFGAINGVVIFIETITKKQRKKLSKKMKPGLLKALGYAYLYVFSVFTFVLFKVDTFPHAVNVWKAALTFSPLQDLYMVYLHFVKHVAFPATHVNSYVYLLLFLKKIDSLIITLSVLAVAFVEKSVRVKSGTGFTFFYNKTALRWASYLLLLFCIMEFGVFHKVAEFIYGQY